MLNIPVPLSAVPKMPGLLSFNLAEKHMSYSKLSISNCSDLAALVTLKFGTDYEENQHEKGPFFYF